MATSNNGLLSPLQLEAGAGMLNNSGNVFGVAPDFVAKVDAYQSTLVSNIAATLALAATANLSNATIAGLTSIGSISIPALGDSTPFDYWNTNYPVPVANVYLLDGNSFFSGQVLNIGNSYLGDGNAGKFAQVFFAATGYVDTVNVFINSAVNANTTSYLGPTYNQVASGEGNMDNLITGEITKLTLATQLLGDDLSQLGQAIDLANLDNFGTPAALLQQIGNLANFTGTLPCVETALKNAGLTNTDIVNLVSNNQLSALNPDGLSENEFNRLQRLAYQGMQNVAGDCLAQVLTVLDVTTPNIVVMTDLLDPKIIFPESYMSFTYAGPNGPELIYDDNGDVNQILVANGPTGCDELGKIIPPDQAVANRSIAVSLQQVKNIAQVTLPELASILVA